MDEGHLLLTKKKEKERGKCWRKTDRTETGWQTAADLVEGEETGRDED